MTTHDDLDRVLGDWLAEGPVHVPEHLVGATLQHARSHPRRPDPLRVLRRDPMAGRSRFAPLGIAPVPLMAAIGLLLVAALGVSLVGGQRDDVPVPLPSTSGDPSAVPSPNLSLSPSASPGPSFPIRVELQTSSAATMLVEVTDASGLLVDARSGLPAEGGSVPLGEVSSTNVDDSTVELTWTDAACDIAYALDIETTTSMTLRSPVCSGDTIALDRRLLLEFSVPVDAAEIQVQVVGSAEGASPAP